MPIPCRFHPRFARKAHSYFARKAVGAALLLTTATFPATLPGLLQAQVTPWATTEAPAVDSTTLPEDRGADGLAQTLNKLRTWASLLMIVAHPDDEDGGMMAYESRGAGVRTALLTLTRGEGGQNAISGESYDALGLIRTQELLASDRYSGTEQLWGTEADYGFSKTKEEAFAQWTHDRVLRDVVRAVRQQRPLVLTSVFIGGVTDGHGHHQVAGQLTQEAFNAAGDPKVFPDQIAAGLRPWKPLAVYARSPFAPITARGMYDYATNTWAPPSFTNYVTGEHTSTPPVPDVAIPEGTHDAVLGRSYLQMAREGWGLQKSQNGGGNPPLAGPDTVTYHRYGERMQLPTGEPEKTGFFTGIDTTLPGMIVLAHGGDTGFVAAGLRRIDNAVTRAYWGYTPAVPGRITGDLVEALKATQALLGAVQASSLTAESKADLTHELEIKSVQCDTALVEALGLHMAALVTPTPARSLNGAAPHELTLSPQLSRANVVPGESFEVRLHVSSAVAWSPVEAAVPGAGAGLRLARTGLDAEAAGGAQWQIERLGTAWLGAGEASAGDVLFRVTVPRGAEPTAPYFTRPSIEQAYYDVSDPKLAGRSATPDPVSAFAEFSYDGVTLHLAEVVQGVQRELGRGDYNTPLVVTPGLSVTLPQHIAVLPSGARSLAVPATVTNEGSEAADVDLRLEVPKGWTASAGGRSQLAPGERSTVNFEVKLPPGEAKPASDDGVQAVARAGNLEYSSGFVTAGYPGLRPTNLYQPARLEVRRVDVQVTPGVRVGYVPGTGDEVPAALRALGVPVDMLTPAALLSTDLRPYSTILLGVRTYTAEAGLSAAQGVLEQFARQGGTVVVQYQSNDFAGVPYPLHLGNAPAKVVDEHSPVTLLHPDNALLTTPNRIMAADFNGWVEERGHGFAASWAPEWTPLLATEDPGQAPQQGGLLVAQVGRGRYIYAALALYRQLPEGVPGAYRLLANLVSAGRPGQP